MSFFFGDSTTLTHPSPSYTYANNSFYRACVQVSNSCGDNIYCQDIFLWPEGMHELQTTAGEIKIYPNPANEYLYVEGAETGMKLTILNTLGQVVYNGVVSSRKD